MTFRIGVAGGSRAGDLGRGVVLGDERPTEAVNALADAGVEDGDRNSGADCALPCPADVG